MNKSNDLAESAGFRARIRRRYKIAQIGPINTVGLCIHTGSRGLGRGRSTIITRKRTAYFEEGSV